MEDGGGEVEVGERELSASEEGRCSKRSELLEVINEIGVWSAMRFVTESCGNCNARCRDS